MDSALIHLIETGVIAAAAVGITEALKQAGLPTRLAPLASIFAGVALVAVYVGFPPEARSVYAMLLAGGVGTGVYGLVAARAELVSSDLPLLTGRPHA